MRIGAVSYLNTKPLVYGLAALAPRAEVVYDLPSRLADELAVGKLDVALIPSIEFAVRARDAWEKNRNIEALDWYRHSIEAGESQTVLGKGGAVTMTAFLVQHGNIPALGYRIGDAAYTPDLNDIPRESWGALENLDLWIVDGLRYTSHVSHFSINDALSWIERFKPKRAVITNMHSDLDYEVLRLSLPQDVIPAYDGMRLVVG